MNPNEKPPTKASIKIAIFQAVACVFLALFAGVVYPLLVAIVQGPDESASWQASFLLGLRWYWTLPVGVILAVIIVWISHKLPETARAIFGFITSLVLLAFALFLTWLMLSV